MVQMRTFQDRSTVAYRQPVPPPSTSLPTPATTAPTAPTAPPLTGSSALNDVEGGRAGQHKVFKPAVSWAFPAAAALTAIFAPEQPEWKIQLWHASWEKSKVDDRITRATSLRNMPGDAERFEYRWLTHVLATQFLEDSEFPVSAKQPLKELLVARTVSASSLTRVERLALVDLHDYGRLTELNQLDVACHRSLSPTELSPQVTAERRDLRERVYEWLQDAQEAGCKLSAANTLLLTGLLLEKVHGHISAGTALPQELAVNKSAHLAQIAYDVRAAGIDIPFDLLATSPEVVALYTRLHDKLHETDVGRANFLKLAIMAHRDPTYRTPSDDEPLSDHLSKKTKALRSNLCRDRVWSANDALWTRQRDADPALSLWHHPLLSVTQSQHSYDLVARAIGRVVGADQAAEYVRHPMIWSALYLLREGLPEGMVQDATLYPLKDWKQTRDLWHVLDAVREDDAVRAAVGVALEMGLGSFFSQVWPAFPAASASELKVAELVIQGARLVWDTRDQGYKLAEQHGQRFGVEVEFVAAKTLPDTIDFRTEKVDRIYERVAQALRDAGFDVRTGHFDSNFFDLLPATKWLAAEYWQFQSTAAGDRDARSVRYLLLRGTGATMVFEYQLDAAGQPVKTQRYPTTHEDENADGAVLTQARLDMRRLASKLLGVNPASIGDLMQSRRNDLEVEGVRRETGTVLMTKDKQGGIPQALVRFNPDGKSAQVVGLNLLFNNPGGEPLESLTLTAQTEQGKQAQLTLDQVQKQLGERIKADPSFYLMTNRKSGLEIGDIEGVLRAIDEQHLINEVVTQRLTMGEMALRVVEAMVRGLALAGYPSTSDHTAAGLHVHAEVTEPAQLLRVMRDYARDEAALLALLNPNPSRQDFIQPVPDELKRRLALPGYCDVTTDSGATLRPAERKALAWQELCRWADVATETPPKYNGVNEDNYIALRVRELILGEKDKAGNWVVHPVLEDGDTATISDFYGRVYQFTVKSQQAKDEDGNLRWDEKENPIWDYGVTVRYNGKDYPVNRVADALIKSTVELRTPNFSSVDRDERVPVLDPAAAVLPAAFWPSYVALRRFGGVFVQ